MNLYQMKMMGFEYPDIYQYISALMNNIDECINLNIEKGNQARPTDIIEDLGQDIKNIEEYNFELCGIIDLLYKQKAMKYDKEDEVIEKDLADLSKNLLKILEISDKEVESRYQESDKTLEIQRVDLQLLLSENPNKSKLPVLKKAKK